ncbi:MAG: glycosyltransferase [Planctomycetota bacterium]
MTRIKIMFVIATLDAAGAEGQVVALASRLDRERFDPFLAVLTRGGPLESDLQRAGVPYEILWKRHKVDRVCYRRLRELMARRRPDIVHTWLFTANTYGRMAAAAEGVRGILASERAVDTWKTSLHRWIDRRLAARSQAILVNSQAVERFLVDGEGIPAGKIVRILNGVEAGRFHVDFSEVAQTRHLLGIEGPRPVLMTTARLVPEKGLERLLEITARLRREFPTIAVIVAGEGWMRKTLIRHIRRRGLERSVILLGARRDIPALLGVADVYVSTSLSEGLPNAVLEAMAAGVPVVASAVGGTPEVIRDGENGCLLEVDDINGYIQCIRLLLHDPDARKRLARTARRDVEGPFSMECMVAQHQELYSAITAGHSP